MVEATDEAVGIDEAQDLLLIILSPARRIWDIGKRIKADQSLTNGVECTRWESWSYVVQVIAGDRQRSGRIDEQ